MKRISMGILIPAAVFIGLFNLLFFVIGDASSYTVAVWISYAFIHFAFLVSVITPLFTSGRKDFARQGSVSYLFTGTYFALACIIGLIFIFVAPTSDGGVKASWIIQVVLFGVFVISFVPVYMANAHTNEEIVRQGKEARFLQDAASRVKLLRDSASDSAVIVELDVLRSVIAASPTKSSLDVRELELQMLLQLSELEEAVDGNDLEKTKGLCKKITRGVKERNRILQLVSHD